MCTGGVCPRTRARIFGEGLTEEESAITVDMDMDILETERMVLRNVNAFYREANKDERVKSGFSRVLDEFYT
jgi:hypothetical protein